MKKRTIRRTTFFFFLLLLVFHFLSFSFSFFIFSNNVSLPQSSNILNFSHFCSFDSTNSFESAIKTSLLPSPAASSRDDFNIFFNNHNNGGEFILPERKSKIRFLFFSPAAAAAPLPPPPLAPATVGFIRHDILLCGFSFFPCVLCFPFWVGNKKWRETFLFWTVCSVFFLLFLFFFSLFFLFSSQTPAGGVVMVT